MLLVRKVNLLHWTMPHPGIPDEEVAAEALTYKKSILAAEKNALSFWRFDPSQEGWERDAALSVLTNVYEPVDLTWVEESAVRAAGIEITVERGKSFLADAADRHVDLVNLGSKKLSDLAIMLKASIRANDCRSFTIEELVALLRVAGQARRVVIDSLPNDWKKAVRGG